MKRNIIETVLGAVVLVVASIFLLYSTTATNAGKVSGYPVVVRFNEIGALKQGDDVRISGVKIGSVSSVDLDNATFQAKVTLSIDDAVKLPKDTGARVSSESLMGGAYIGLDPGAEEENIRPGGNIAYAQDAQNLEQLLGKFIFSASEQKETAPAAPAVMPSMPAPSVMPQM